MAAHGRLLQLVIEEKENVAPKFKRKLAASSKYIKKKSKLKEAKRSQVACFFRAGMYMYE